MTAVQDSIENLVRILDPLRILKNPKESQRIPVEQSERFQLNWMTAGQESIENLVRILDSSRTFKNPKESQSMAVKRSERIQLNSNIFDLNCNYE